MQLVTTYTHELMIVEPKSNSMAGVFSGLSCLGDLLSTVVILVKSNVQILLKKTNQKRGGGEGGDEPTLNVLLS